MNLNKPIKSDNILSPFWLPSLLLALAPAVSLAAEPLTLPEAIQEARAHNPQLQRIEAAADEASSRSFEALSGFLPKLSFGANRLFASKFQTIPVPAFGTEFPAVQPITVASVDLGINLFDGFQTTNSYRAALLASEAAHREAGHAALQIEDDVRLKFYQALSAQQLADVADQNVKTLQDHLAKTKALLSGGATTKLDTLRVEVQLSEAMPDQIQAHDNVLITRRSLAQAMGLEQDERPVTGALPVPQASQLPNDLKLEIGRRDDLVALQDRAQAAGDLKLSSYSAFLPRINLMGEYQYYNNRDDSYDSAAFRNAYTVGVSLSWSLFDAASFARRSEAAAQQVQAEKAAEAASQRAPVDFELWRRRFLSNVALYQARTRAIESANESVRLSRIGYEAGTRTNTDVLDTELDLFRARAGVVRAQVDAAEALINLELAVGHHL